MVVPSPALTDSICGRLGWATCDIWEVSDDQALNNGGGGYGPLAHIIPSEHLNSFTSTSTFTAAGSSGLHVAIIIVDTAVLSPYGRKAGQGGGGAAGGTSGIPPLPVTYQALGLQTGYNCVYLRHEGGADETGWTAFVSRAVLTTANPCPPPQAGARTLSVVSTQHPFFTASDDYPAVTRWQEGSQGGTMWLPQFGLKCGNRWCIVMPNVDTLPNPQIVEVPGGLNSTTARPYRAWLVRGWSDVQHLGESPITPGGGPQPRFNPAGLHSAMVPDSGLGSYTTATFSAGRWIHVATLWLNQEPGAMSKYRTKWKLKQGKNEIFLQTDATKPGGWTGILVAGPDTVLLDVERMDHGTHFIPGVARFRWDFSDEQGWIRCDVGCCKVSPH